MALLAGVAALVAAHPVTIVCGETGSGKTTTFNMISGYHRPTSGRVLFEGREILTGGGTPYTVFTPYLRAWVQVLDATPVPVADEVAFTALRTIFLRGGATLLLRTDLPGAGEVRIRQTAVGVNYIDVYQLHVGGLAIERALAHQDAD